MSINQLRKKIAMIFWRIRGGKSGAYWEMRYRQGGNSGAGSYGRLSMYKAEFINEFADQHNIDEAIEFGCGDGNQLSQFHFSKYIGFDVSKSAIKRCKKQFEGDTNKEFYEMNEYNSQKADLTLSLDVIYHLLEDDVFVNYMKNLFEASRKYVIIYSSDVDNNIENVKHVRHRKFTRWIEENIFEFKLLRTEPQRYEYSQKNSVDTSYANFFVYERTNKV